VHVRAGPIDILVVGFDGTEFDPAIGAALRNLAALDGFCIVDLGTSAVLLAIEHAWTGPFDEAVRASGGELPGHARVPDAAVGEVRRGAV
jgi:hypothetical protein